MSSHKLSVLETRREQVFPTLPPEDIALLQRFGETGRYKPGDYLETAGEPAPGMVVILSGDVEIAQRNALGRDDLIATFHAGSFMAELSLLSGAPSLVDALAKTEVEAIVIPPEKLRELMVEEAELGERIMRALILRRVALLESGGSGPVIVGDPESSDVLRLGSFLARNGHPHQILDPKDEPARELLRRSSISDAELPVVFCPAGKWLTNPKENELAQCLGLVKPIDPSKLYDLAIVGAGPAGLAAAVYAASEGLETIVLDCRAFGGQAGASARIENYLGFPTGISGLALMARAYNQAQKFGARVSIPDEAAKLETAGEGEFALETSDGDRLRTRAVVIATGARYRRLKIPNSEQFDGSHVHYWASALEATLCAGQEVVLVGAGNSAGQGAVFLGARVQKVWMLMRGNDLHKTMSNYLVERISAQKNIEVLAETQLTVLEGHDGKLDRVRWQHKPSGKETERPIRHVFLFCGADPNTDWLKASDIAVDGKHFIRTGFELGKEHPPLETSIRGVFAIGDVRAGSTKRVASAVGEGAQVVAAVHAYLA